MREFPKIMGILNVTPDSFSDGGKYTRAEDAIEHALNMIEDGADIIDIGGESTRPGAAPIAEDEELARVIPVIEGVLNEKPGTVISIDTTKYSVAREAVSKGAKIINDVSGLRFDTRLANLAADKGLALILMHMQGEPRNMQANPAYQNVVEDVFSELAERIALARSLGVKSVIADVGIGFGKTVDHNLILLKNHRRFCDLGVPLMLGLSRKTFLGKILDIGDPRERDMPTALAHALLLECGADLIRVHNVVMINMLKKLYYALSQPKI